MCLSLIALDGYWSTWGSWSDSSEDCGTGTQTRTRSCDDPAPLNDGDTCLGSSTDTQSCNTMTCRKSNINVTFRNSYYH